MSSVSVNDMPKFLVENPIVDDHAIFFLSDTNDSSLLILFMLQGVTSYFPVRAATMSEYKNDIIQKNHLTAESLILDPSLSSYSLQEEYILDFRGQIVSTVSMTRGQITMQVNAVSSSPFASYCVVDATDDDNFGISLEFFVQISLTSTSMRAAVNHDKLAKHWGISLYCAKATVQHTTQHGVCMIANPVLSRQFWIAYIIQYLLI